MLGIGDVVYPEDVVIVSVTIRPSERHAILRKDRERLLRRIHNNIDELFSETENGNEEQEELEPIRESRRINR